MARLTLNKVTSKEGNNLFREQIIWDSDDIIPKRFITDDIKPIKNGTSFSRSVHFITLTETSSVAKIIEMRCRYYETLNVKINRIDVKLARK